MNWFPDYNYILASKSPRRSQLLKSLGIPFTVRTKEVDEVYPSGLSNAEVPVFLAKLKAAPFLYEITEKDLIITADTVVCLNKAILGKPANYNEAFQMLESLSGIQHQVITGVCLTSKLKSNSFSATTNVQFKLLTKDEIDYYISTFQPYDKAGAYGIQEWIGAIGIKNIQGSFYNVMGLPVQKLYEKIKSF